MQLTIGEYYIKMLKKIYNLFKILRKLSISGAIETLDQLKTVPLGLKILFKVFSLGSNKNEKSLDHAEKTQKDMQIITKMIRRI